MCLKIIKFLDFHLEISWNRPFTLGHTFFVLFLSKTIKLNLLVSLHKDVSIDFNIICYSLSLSLSLSPSLSLILSLSMINKITLYPFIRLYVLFLISCCEMNKWYESMYLKIIQSNLLNYTNLCTLVNILTLLYNELGCIFLF